jgi:hypothetical protein
MSLITIAGGRITCLRCRAKAKRSQKQCRSPAVGGRAVCRVHGGLSTGPKTEAGRLRCAAAKTIHGRETRAIRAERSRQLAQVAALEDLGRAVGLFVGPRLRGRKPSPTD